MIKKMTIIKSFSVGNGDMFYIKHGSENFTIIDCNMDNECKREIVDELIDESRGKDIKRFISTHPDDDHICGLKYLQQRMGIKNFYCVKNEATKKEETEDFKEYCHLREMGQAFFLEKGCSRRWMNKSGGEEGYGSAGINILWPVVNNYYFKEELDKVQNGDSPNNISPIIKYSLKNGVTVLWFGDLEREFMEKIVDDVMLEKADIIFAPHHGRKSGKIPQKWLNCINPKIIVIGEAESEMLDYYEGFNTITQNSAGDIIFYCEENCVDIYVSNDNYDVGFLDDNYRDYKSDEHYIGTLEL